MWCVWLENLDLDFEFATTYEIQKWFLHWETRLCISFYLSSFEIWPKKTAHKNSELARAYIINRKNKYKKNYKSFMGFPNETVKENQWNPYLDFLIEIRLEDELFEVDIHFRILLQNPKSEFQKVNQNLPIEHDHSHLNTSSLTLEMRFTAVIDSFPCKYHCGLLKSLLI